MKTIHKFEIPITDKSQLTMPDDSEILSFAFQGNKCFIWVLVETDNTWVTRKFRLVGTGHPIDPNYEYLYIGAVHNFRDEFVFHLFEILK